MTALGLQEALNMGSIIEGEFTTEGKELVVQPSQELTVIQSEVVSNKLEDSDYIRTELKTLVEKTKDALDAALDVQSEIPDPKNTEAVSKMADSVSKMLDTLIKLNKAEKDEEFRNREKEVAPKVVNNNLIVMTTQELINKILNQTKQLKGK